VFEAYFRSVLEVALKMLRDGQGVKLWSGGDRPAPPTSSRESPLDGDAFRLCESIIMAEHGADSFVLVFHIFSDASQLAWSGGTLMGEPHVVVMTSYWCSLEGKLETMGANCACFANARCGARAPY